MEAIGKIVARVAERLIEGLPAVIDRAALARKVRDVADEIERGDVVNDAELAKARETLAKIRDARDAYR